jgi:hypothetical protein
MMDCSVFGRLILWVSVLDLGLGQKYKERKGEEKVKQVSTLLKYDFQVYCGLPKTALQYFVYQ